MRALEEYGLPKDGKWEMLPWIPDPRPPFELWIRPEELAPFFIVQHHPYAIALLLKMSDGFQAEMFRKCGLTGGSGDWEALAKRLLAVFGEDAGGADRFAFDSDADAFCMVSQYIDDLLLFARMLRGVCADEKQMAHYLSGGGAENS